ncbi:MAG: helix-turn-helix transcriptional regulator [Alphaproteobacteria bacterium]|nr:helix-turn-helix transcriptional regulator [Alphaproteobacteria bacterium]
MTISKQLEVRMKAKNLSIMTVESKAGLKTHAVRNILRGKSKRPSAVNLQAIADVLDCSVKDLLGAPEALQEDSQTLSLEEVLQEKYTSYDKAGLMPKVVKTVESLAQKQNKDLTVEQFLTSVREIYLHSLQKDPSKVDTDFAEWFMGLMVE